MDAPRGRAIGRCRARLTATVRHERFTFDDLRAISARANEPKLGAALAGLAARSGREWVAARRVLADISLPEVVDRPLIDPDADEVSRLMSGHLARLASDALAGLAVASPASSRPATRRDPPGFVPSAR